jgi:hypothetical protein
MGFKWDWKAWTILAAAAVLTCWVIGTSEALEGFIHTHKHQRTYEALYQSHSFIGRTLVRIRLNIAAVGHFTAENGEAITALFTIVLAGSTIFLWRATEKLYETGENQIAAAADAAAKQAIDTATSLGLAKDAADAAKTAADAADRSARTAVGVELPILHVESVSAGSELTTEPTNWANKIFITVSVKNYGRSPAVVKEAVINVHIGIKPDTPTYTKIRQHPKESVLESGITRDFVETGYYNSGTFPAQILPATDESVWIYIYGYFDYIDFLGMPHRKGFIFLWIPANLNFTPLHNPEYHYQT